MTFLDVWIDFPSMYSKTKIFPPVCREDRNIYWHGEGFALLREFRQLDWCKNYRSKFRELTTFGWGSPRQSCCGSLGLFLVGEYFIAFLRMSSVQVMPLEKTSANRWSSDRPVFHFFGAHIDIFQLGVCMCIFVWPSPIRRRRQQLRSTLQRSEFIDAIRNEFIFSSRTSFVSDRLAEPTFVLAARSYSGQQFRIWRNERASQWASSKPIRSDGTIDSVIRLVCTADFTLIKKFFSFRARNRTIAWSR